MTGRRFLCLASIPAIASRKSLPESCLKKAMFRSKFSSAASRCIAQYSSVRRVWSWSSKAHASASHSASVQYSRGGGVEFLLFTNAYSSLASRWLYLLARRVSP